MTPNKMSNRFAQLFMEEMTARVVAESGRACDRFHLGKIMLQSLRDAPDFVAQIDGSTGVSETNQSVLERSVRCAIALQRLGLKHGDVMVLMAPNHLDLVVPMYAALYLGLPVAAIDRFSTVGELKSLFPTIKPSVVFCQSEKSEDLLTVRNDIGFNYDIVTFDESRNFKCLSQLIEKNGISVEEFQASNFDPEDTIALLVSTSGTTGVPKVASLTHKNLFLAAPNFWLTYTKFPTPTRLVFNVSHIQWLTALINFIIVSILRITRLQSSLPMTQEHVSDLLKKYKPTFLVISPTLAAVLFSDINKNKCDISCFENIMIGGSAVSAKFIEELKEVAPHTGIYNTYGMSELAGIIFSPGSSPIGSSGKPMELFKYRLVDVNTGKDTTEPNIPGELWVKGPAVYKGYYNNPAVTAESFAEDNWFKTGDIFYRDEYWNFYFVERIKLLMKYMNHQISPTEIETTIRQHPGVLDVAVSSVSDHRGDLPVAFTVRRPGYKTTAQEVKDLVRELLTDTKQLRGGVIFIDELPLTATTKVNRQMLKKMALKMERL